MAANDYISKIQIDNGDEIPIRDEGEARMEDLHTNYYTKNDVYSKDEVEDVVESQKIKEYTTARIWSTLPNVTPVARIDIRMSDLGLPDTAEAFDKVRLIAVKFERTEESNWTLIGSEDLLHVWAQRHKYGISFGSTSSPGRTISVFARSKDNTRHYVMFRILYMIMED